MNKKIISIMCASILAGLVAMPSSATQLRSSAYFETESTTESSGMRAGSFSASGEEVQISGSAFYDSGRTTDEYGMTQYSNELTEVEYSAKASSTFGSLRSETSLSYIPRDPSSLDEGTFFNIEGSVRDNPSYGSVYANASFKETFVISGGDTGTEGIIKLYYHLDGTNISPTITNGDVSIAGGAGSSTHMSIGESITYDNPNGTGTITTLKSGSVTSIGTGFNGVYDEVVELPLSFIFDEEFTLYASLTSLTTFNFFEYSPSSFSSFSTGSFFYNTALLDDIQVFNQNGEAINFSLSAASGSQVFEGFSTLDNMTSVPEPTTLVLLTLGLAGIGYSRKSSK